MAAGRRSMAGLLVTAFLAGGSLIAASEPEAPPSAKGRNRIPPAATRTVSPVHPPELMKRLVTGEALVSCLVGETGAVIEAKVESATHPEFGEAAVAAARQWEFTPGTIDGKPAPMRVRIPFDFALSIDQQFRLIFGRPVFQEVTGPVISAQELAAWPVPAQALMPRYPKELEGTGKYGKAVVSIVIDKEGLVINPRIVKATYPEFEMPALLTAARLRFPPQVMANREHIYVSLDLQFDFKPPRKSEVEKPADKTSARPR